MRDYIINTEFTDHLNRHFNVIQILKDKFKKISVLYEFSNSYGRGIVRFLIRYELLDNYEFSKTDEKLFEKYLGSESYWHERNPYVSFIYKSQGSYEVDFEVLESFIFHYQFAANLFEGFIKEMVPKDCVIEVESLEEDPVFNYAMDFLTEIRHSSNSKSVKNEYKKVMLRDFDFDINYHKILREAANNFDDIKNIITDIEIFESTNTDIEDLRRFVIKHEVSFRIDSYLNTINKIYIEISSLKQKLSDYEPSSWEKIYKSRIFDLLQRKINSALDEEKFLQKIINDSKLNIGDYILVEDKFLNGDISKIGLIKEFGLDYTDNLKISYNVLKKNFQESKLNLQSTAIEKISYFLQESQQDNINKMSSLSKETQIKLFKSVGKKNPYFKKLKK